MNNEVPAVEANALIGSLSDFQDKILARRGRDRLDADVLLHLLETLERVEASALRLESDIEDENAMWELKRSLHTIKGDAGVLGLPEVSHVFHSAEEILEKYLEVRACPVDMLLKIRDWLQQILDRAGSQEATDEGASAGDDEPNGVFVKTQLKERPRFTSGALKESFSRNPEPVQHHENLKDLKMLIAEDDFTGRLLLQEFLLTYGPVHVAVNGREAVEAVKVALETDEHYDLICLDIMMPEMDGIATLKEIRAMEEAKGILSFRGVKILMTTVLDDIKNISTAYFNLCDGYIVKPISSEVLLEKLYELGLIPLYGGTEKA